MKKFLSIACTFLFFATAFAQVPEKGSNQISFGIQSNNSSFLIFKHYYKDKAAYRLGLTGSYNYTKSPSSVTSNYPSNNNYTTSGYYKNENYGILAGLQKSFTLIENVEPYLGLDLVLANSINKNYSEEIYLNGDFDKRTYSQKFQPTASLLPFAGVNFYIKKNFAIGAEYRINLISGSLAAKTSNFHDFSIGGTEYISNTATKGGSSFSAGFSGIGGITVSYFFK